MDIRLYRNRECEESLPQIRWGAEDLHTRHIRRGFTPTQAVKKLLADLARFEALGLPPDQFYSSGEKWLR